MSRVSYATRPAEIAAFLHNNSLIRQSAAACAINPAVIDEIVVGATELLRRPARLNDLVRCARSLFDELPWQAAAWSDTPRDTSAGERFFLLYPFLQRLPLLSAWYASRNIPQQIMYDTLKDFQIWLDTELERHGRVEFRQASWMREHFHGRIIRLGRLQFQPSTFRAPFVPLVNRKSGVVQLVAHGGAAITAEGIFSDSEGATGQQQIELIYEECAGEVRRGHAVLPNGRIAIKPTRFEPGRWRRALATGAPTLALHIPAGEPLAPAACHDSFRRAARFYPRYFAERPAPRAITCGSWLFYPGLAGILPPDSNIVRFQTSFMRFPLPGATANQIWERVFVPYGRAIQAHQLHSSLQQRLYQHIMEGHTPIVAGGLLLPPFDSYGALSPTSDMP